MDNDAAPSPTKSIVEQPCKAVAQEAAKSIGGCPEGGDQGVGGHLLGELWHLKGRLERARVGGNKYAARAEALENKTKYFETNCGGDR